jgi:galactonate dehydratase
MKVLAYELFKVPPRWLFLKLTTDDGLVGWGEPIVEGRADTVIAAVRELCDQFIVGSDPERINDLWQAMYRGGFYRGGAVHMSAISGIDQALWDIKGKRYNVPIYQLLGGAVRNSIPVYTWIGGDRPDDVARDAERAMEFGFTAVKMNATAECHYVDSNGKLDAVIDRVAAAREAGGAELKIGIDFHGRLHKSMARLLAKLLEPLRPMFIEEPVLPENEEALREIRQATAIPIATGERLYSRWDFKRLLVSGNIDIVQPDPSHAGGISECVRIGQMAEAYDVAVAPHCPLGPICLAAAIQIDAVLPNAVIQEQSTRIHYNQQGEVLDYVINKDVFGFTDGIALLPTLPGLGIEIDEAAVRRAAERGHDWHNPVWRNADGTIAEW